MVGASEAERESGNESLGQLDGDEVRPPLPVIREALYDDALMYGYEFLSIPILD